MGSHPSIETGWIYFLNDKVDILSTDIGGYAIQNGDTVLEDEFEHISTLSGITTHIDKVNGVVTSEFRQGESIYRFKLKCRIIESK
ncbi:hypothetical protein VYA_03400 [Vibrio alfacsensis]|nr:hypothetical protein VYA_03400 [Vibrio alfacsensis]